MKVIITMAGAASRFKQAGITTEKHKLRIRDRSMFEYAMSSLDAFFDYEFVFVTRDDHDAVSFLEEACATLGIDRYQVVELSELTSGQATTALEAAPHVAADDSVVIYNIDTYIEGTHLHPDKLDGDGCIPVFEASGGSWSFVATDQNGRAIDVAEKEQISEYASVGMYYFDRFEWFQSALEAAGRSVEQEYGERYVAPLYNWMIQNGMTVKTQLVPESAIHILGTPDEAREFDPEFAERYGLRN